MSSFDNIDWRSNIASRSNSVKDRLTRIRSAGAKGSRSKVDYPESEQACSDNAISLLAECVENSVVPPEQLLDLFVSILIPDTRFDQHDQETLAKAGIGMVGSGIWASLNHRRVAILLGVKPAQLPKFYLAAECEAGYPPHPEGLHPSIAPIDKVAKAASVDRKTIKAWRKLSTYREKVIDRREFPREVMVG